MSRFRYSEKAWLPLWFFYFTWWAFIMAKKGPEDLDFSTAFLAGFGLLTVVLLAFLFVLDLIEWRWPGK